MNRYLCTASWSEFYLQVIFGGCVNVLNMDKSTVKIRYRRDAFISDILDAVILSATTSAKPIIRMGFMLASAVAVTESRCSIASSHGI